MNVCFPVMENQGMESEVYGHFGSAPGFVIVDIVTSAVDWEGIRWMRSWSVASAAACSTS
jgi:predicted Fe-Mo cluster-binding NifX family protein